MGKKDSISTHLLNKRGFALIEGLVAASLLFIVALALAYTVENSSKGAGQAGWKGGIQTFQQTVYSLTNNYQAWEQMRAVNPVLTQCDGAGCDISANPELVSANNGLGSLVSVVNGNGTVFYPIVSTQNVTAPHINYDSTNVTHNEDIAKGITKDGRICNGYHSTNPTNSACLVSFRVYAQPDCRAGATCVNPVWKITVDPKPVAATLMQTSLFFRLDRQQFYASVSNSMIASGSSSATGSGPGSGTGPGSGSAGSGSGSGSATGVGTGSDGTGCIASGGWTSCFVAGTLIDTPFGPRPIETLSPGEEVFSMSSAGRMEKNRVGQFFKHEVNSYLKIKFSSGSELKVTEEHPIYVSNFADYVEAGKLRVGMLVVQAGKDGELGTQEILSIEKIETPETVYNISVDENHNYFAEGILVHNKQMWCFQDCTLGGADACGSVGGTTTGSGTGTGSGSGSGSATTTTGGTGGTCECPQMYWSNAGPIVGKDCINIVVPDDAPSWAAGQNYLCFDSGSKPAGLVWSYNGAVANHSCFPVAEPNEPCPGTAGGCTGWWNVPGYYGGASAKTYLCIPDGSTHSGFQFSALDPIAGKSCIATPSSTDNISHWWYDNYLCCPKANAGCNTGSGTTTSGTASGGGGSGACDCYGFQTELSGAWCRITEDAASPCRLARWSAGVGCEQQTHNSGMGLTDCWNTPKCQGYCSYGSTTGTSGGFNATPCQMCTVVNE